MLLVIVIEKNLAVSLVQTEYFCRSVDVELIIGYSQKGLGSS